MMLVESPVSRSMLWALSCQILTACLRTCEKAANSKAFGLHIAVWQASFICSTDQEILEAQKTRLNQMSCGTHRCVQFVNVEVNEPVADDQSEPAQRRDELIAKINAIEALPNVPPLYVKSQVKRKVNETAETAFF